MTTTLQVSVDAAEVTDSADLVRLYEAGQAGIDGQRGAEMHTLLHARRRPVEDTIHADLDDPSTSLLVGRVNGVTVGYACARRTPDNLCVITDLFVLPDARGVGVGAALFQAILGEAQETGCRGIDARALPGDRTTKNFFESFGLVARSIEVHRDLRND